jgi:hypothetical protein
LTEASGDTLTTVNISDIRLRTPEGAAVTLGEYIERPTVVVLVRYFG